MVHAGSGRENTGFTLIEYTIAISLFVAGALGFASAILSGQSMMRSNRDRSLADHELETVVERFRTDCSRAFDATITAYRDATFKVPLLPGVDSSAVIKTEIILDETRLTPPADLNGNGNATDKAIDPASLQLAVINASITWWGPGGTQKRYSRAYVARGEVSAASGGGNNTGGNKQNNGGNQNNGGGPVVSLDTATLNNKGDNLSVNLKVAQGPVNVVAVTLDSTKLAYLKEIRVNGNKVLNLKKDYPKTGTKIATTPFTLSDGFAFFDKFAFADARNGRGTPNMKGSDFNLRLHLEGGGEIDVTIKAP